MVAAASPASAENGENDARQRSFSKSSDTPQPLSDPVGEGAAGGKKSGGEHSGDIPQDEGAPPSPSLSPDDTVDLYLGPEAELVLRASLRECYQMLTIHKHSVTDVAAILEARDGGGSPRTNLMAIVGHLSKDLEFILTECTDVTNRTQQLCVALLRELSCGNPLAKWSLEHSAAPAGINLADEYGEQRAVALVGLVLELPCGNPTTADHWQRLEQTDGFGTPTSIPAKPTATPPSATPTNDLSSSSMFHANLLNYLIWLDSPNSLLRGAALSSLLRIAETSPHMLHEAVPGMIEAIESKLRAHLIRTSLLSGARHSATGVLAARHSRQRFRSHPIDESNRTPARTFFTVLSTVPEETHRYPPDRSHMCIGSQCFARILALYMKGPAYKMKGRWLEHGMSRRRQFRLETAARKENGKPQP